MRRQGNQCGGFALIRGALFGLNRELHGKPAGLRTHALVCLECRAGIGQEKPRKGRLTFLAVGDHDAIRRLLKGL